jgi:hypothetical protein
MFLLLLAVFSSPKQTANNTLNKGFKKLTTITSLYLD